MGKGDRSIFYSFLGKEGLQGGLNISDDPLIVSPKEMVIAKNISIAQSLSRKKRPGKELYHTGSFEGTASFPNHTDPIRGLLQYWRFASDTGEVQEDIVLHQSSHIWRVPNRTQAATKIEGSFTPDTAGVPVYQVFEGILYFVTDKPADGYKKWNGLSSSPGNVQTATAPPDGVGKFLGTYKGRMLMAGNPDFPFRVYMSTTLDAEDWTSLDATSFDLTYDGDPNGVTAIFPEQEGRVFIATRRSIYELSGSDMDTFLVQRITQGIGCIAHGAVLSIPNDILFPSDRGLHSLKKLIVSDQSEITFQSRDIQRIWTRLLNRSLLSRAKATYNEDQNEYEITVPSGSSTENDLILSYNISYNLWTTWEGIDARSLGQVLISDTNYVLSGGEDGRLTFLNPELAFDFDEGFQFQMKSGKFFPGGDIFSQYRYKSITVLCSSESSSQIQINSYIDSIDGVKTVNRTATLGQGADLLGSTFILGQSKLGLGRFNPVRVTIEETGFNYQVEIITNGSDDILFHGFILEVEDADQQFR